MASTDVRESTREEEENEKNGEREQSSEAEDVPDRIVISGTPPLGPQREPQAPKTFTKADFDEYFLEYGEAVDEANMDGEVSENLRTIARKRIQEANLQRKKTRQARMAKTEFERLLDDAAGHGVGPSSEVEVSTPSPSLTDWTPDCQVPSLPLRARATRARKSGLPITYGQRDRKPLRATIEPVSDPDFLPELPPPLLAARSSVPSSSHDAPSTPSIGIPLLEDVNIDVGFDQETFFIDDLRRSSHKRRISHSSQSDKPSRLEASATPEDRRAKIARRMMPAVMLKRLEQEAAEKERRSTASRRREDRRGSPIKPGKAIVRRGQGDVEVRDLLGDLASEDEVSDNALVRSPSFAAREECQQRLTVISDDDSSRSSQAYEDDDGEQSLARLYDGDFESLIAGTRPVSRSRRDKIVVSCDRSASTQNRARRPPLGFVKRTRIPLSYGNRSMVQTWLSFPFQDRPAKYRVKAKKHKRQDGGQEVRPAIRLDDHIIFATANFAFNSQQEEPRSFRRSISNMMSEPDPLDAWVGKARSWTNFDRFPIDFDISPLPSGLYCDFSSFICSGGLERLVGHLRGSASEVEHIPTCSAYDIELRSDISADALRAVLPIVFDGIGRDAVGFANEANAEPPTLAPFVFLSLFLLSGSNDVEGINHLRSACRTAIGNLSRKLDEVACSGSQHSRFVRDCLSRLRWTLLELSLLLKLPADPADDDKLVKDCGTAVISQLLAGGFDKTIRPLKMILRAESDTPEIADLSVTLWVAVMHSLSAWDQRRASDSDTLSACLDRALDSAFRLDQTGPIAAERIWFLIFGLSALSQFDIHGRIAGDFTPAPRWSLVRRAVILIKVLHNEESEEKAHLDHLRGRDRYIKAVMARCVRLSSVWRWSFDRESFSVVTKNLGAIFKERQHRNLPTEPPVDYPNWVTRFDMSLTAAEDTKHESAFELYLRLVCVAASDIISSAQTLSEAQQAEKDIQRLIMSIIPVSPVKYNRIFPPSARQLGQLINRFSTMIAACYFSPTLLSWLLANSQKWAPFEQADFASRQVSIRGLMYLAVACRHHQQPLDPVVTRLADILATLQRELDECGKLSAPAQAPSRIEVTHTMVLVVSCFRQIITHQSFDGGQQTKPIYPDPCLLHQSEYRP